jgi:predicted deacylase
LCLKISKGDGKERPAALIGGAIHGDEYIANRTAMAAAKMLVESDEPDVEKILEKMDVYILPLINPDGYASTWESGGDDPSKETRTNDNGVDLNRNFGKPKYRIPLPLGFSGHKNPESDRYVGSEPFSEAEAQAVRRLAQEKKFFAAVDFHCAAGMIIPVLNSHRYTQKGLREMAKAYKGAQSDRYGIYMFPWWMPIYQGSMEECLFREAGTLAILIELCKPKDLKHEKSKENHFWRFNPYDKDVIEKVAKDNARASLVSLLAAYEYTSGKTSPHTVDVY